MLGVQMHELAHICKGVWTLGVIVVGVIGVSTHVPEVDPLELVRQVQTLRV